MIGKRTVWTTMLCAALLSAGAVRAQEAPPGDTIVVEGKALADAAKVRALARAITPRLGFDQPLARFTDPVCFATAGLPRPMLQAIGARMADDAAQAGIELAGERCQPNVLVIFVDDGLVELKSLLKRRPGLFRDKEPAEIRTILAEPGPVHVWSVSEIRSRDGDRLNYGGGGPPTLKVPVATRIGLPVRRDMLSTVMLVDRKAVPGRSLDQIADYAAMRTLAMIRPKGATGGDTILALFDPDTAVPPAGMTGFDRGYLKALYEGSGSQRAFVKVAMIARSISKTGASDADPAPAGDAAARGK
ncbi:hypothetical protein LPN01_17290 [Sphingomonas sp. A2-49]|uniref:hypothetical protein n=1 Tax=Sphingomonas sp. A2-49 TaxID=1391375 RepID=UPI0021CFB2E4|nr:hypothetical protein [Sphingomonas sp. A2-49]MCU6455837.1 hypothetical protein [Sphingomonas sp. A2-49]